MDIEDLLEELADTSSNDQEIQDLQELLRFCWTRLDAVGRHLLSAEWQRLRNKR